MIPAIQSKWDIWTVSCSDVYHWRPVPEIPWVLQTETNQIPMNTDLLHRVSFFVLVKCSSEHWRHNGLQWSAYPVLAEQIRSQQCMPFQIILYDVLVSHYCLSYVYYHDWSFKWVIELIYQLIFHRNTICQKCTMFQYQCNNLHKIFY